MNVRTRELISILPFHHIFAPDEGNPHILDSMANGLSINRHSSSFYKARNAIGVVVQTATDGKTWSLNIELEVLKRRREREVKIKGF
ncbi:Hypothetical protein FKW44_022049 [Caligus rogercresseyi]|uniref:Uncharacterized protein n=1 Tax=Caligus rogercresseyi TaxID=217165 RepID=A0A7T8GS71_CALRO|nr:Hypothetical protein FKW44_022049 [Caligus rogercresseyi]